MFKWKLFLQGLESHSGQLQKISSDSLTEFPSTVVWRMSDQTWEMGGKERRGCLLGAWWVGGTQHCSTVQPAGEQDQEATLRLQGKSPGEQQEETSGGSGFKEGFKEG